MSVHPNVMLMAHLSPNDLPRKTWLAIVADAGADEDHAVMKVGDDEYRVMLMDGYDDGYQIDAGEGEIVLMDMVTYGYGETIAWDALRSKHNALAAWLEANTERYSLASSRISVGANYW